MRPQGEDRVDKEQRFRPDACHAFFNRCHLITYYERDRRFVFAEAFYQQRVVGVSTPTGPCLQEGRGTGPWSSNRATR